MNTYFDLEATFEGYVAGTIVPVDINMFVFDCQPRYAINVHSIPTFVATDNSDSERATQGLEFISRHAPSRVEEWRKFQRILQKAYIVDERVCFLIDDEGNRIGRGRSIEQMYADTWEEKRFWYGRESEVKENEE